MNCIVDTSVWIDHIRKPLPGLIELLETQSVLSHPWVVGEISLGQFKNRKDFLSNLKLLPQTGVAPIAEVFELIERRHLFGRGLSLIDVQLLLSALLLDCGLYTHDLALLNAAKILKIPTVHVKG